MSDSRMFSIVAWLGTTLFLSLSLICFDPGVASGADLEVGARTQVTSGLGGYHPRWSPDSSQIAFVGGDWPDIAIYLIPSAGGELTPVPVDRSGDLSLSWHPDGEHLAFDAYSTGGRLEIYQVELATGTVTQRTLVGAFGPHWSADGTRLSFASPRSGNGDVYSVAANGSDLRRHTSTAAFEYYQQWSPDGTRMAYAADLNGSVDIWILDVATSQTTRFTTDPAKDSRAVWSPCGQWLAWDSWRDGMHHVYARPVDGGETICLTAEHEDGGMADWAPDGSAICYVAEGHIWRLELSGITAAESQTIGSMRAMFAR